MKRIFLLHISLVLFLWLIPSGAVLAQTTGMTDNEVYEFIVKEKDKGTSQQQIAVKLVQRGVQMEQIKRVRDKYLKESQSDLPNVRSVTGQDRLRKNNGDVRDKKQKQPQNIRKRQYKKEDFTDEEYSEFEKRQLRDYTNSLEFLFPDSMSVYGEYDEEKLGKKIIFGHDIFNNKKLTFESGMNIPTPTDYQLGAGDNVFIDIFGASQKNFSSVISPEGTVDIENFGPVQVAGLTVAQATARLRSTLGQQFGDSQIRLTVGQTKTITIQVMGSVMVPGTYTLSSFASVFHALYMAGGVTEVGTLRNVKVFRNNREIATVDVYDYILNGKLSGNVRLADNDVIVVGTYDCLVNIAGKVKRPMYYEMKKDESVETLLQYAGGFSGDAYRDFIRLIRKNGDRYSMFTIGEFERPNFKVNDGDSVSVDSAILKFDNMVMIKGAVNRPGMYEIGKNIKTVRDLVNNAAGLMPEAFTNRAVLHRKKEDKSMTTISLNIKGIIDNEVPDVALQNEDVIYVLDKNELRSEQTLSIFGEVNYPGVYDFSENTTIEDFIIQAGGLKEAASLVKVDVSRRIRDNQSISTMETIARTFTFSLKEGLMVDGDSSFVLQPYDEVYVRRSPNYVEQQHIRIDGEVCFSGEYTLTKKGERLSDAIKKCGGLTPEAYAKGARLERKLTPDEKIKQQSLLKIVAGSDSIDINKVELSDTRPVGINLDMALSHPGDDEWDLVLKEGDRIIVPQYNNTVTLNGEVMYPTTVAYKKGAKLAYYVNKAGGYGLNAKTNHVFAINMNGTVTQVRSAADIQPGCDIVIPSKRKRSRMSLGEVMSLGTMTASLASIIAVLL